jgi:RNA polymerase sigma-70 factor (ECF subfamily)
LKKSVLSDNELVSKFIDGDQSSFEILITRYRKQVYSYILLLIKNQHLAEDIFQDTFVKVIRSLHEGRYRDDGKFLAWVIRIAHNLVIDHFRHKKQMNSVSQNEFGQDVFNSRKFSSKTIEEDIIHEQIEEDVRNLVDYLPDDQKEVLILRHYCGLSFKEIADQTHVSINTALGRMRYALINLRKIVKEKNLILSVQ